MTDTKNKSKKTQYKERSFVRYIYSLMKKNYPQLQMKEETKDQLDKIVKFFSKLVQDNVYERLYVKKKTTISTVELKTTILVLFSPYIGKEMVEYAGKAVKKYEDYLKANGGNLNGKTTTYASGIIFQSGIVELYLRRGGMSNVRVGGTSPIFLAASLEYFTEEIIKGASKYIINNKAIQISPRALYHSIYTNHVLKSIFEKYGIYMTHTGTLSGINTGLLATEAEKKKNKQERMERRNENKKEQGINRSLPGSAALKEIKEYQNTTGTITTKNTFKELIKSILKKAVKNEKLQVSEKVSDLLQIYIEDYMTYYFRKCITVARYNEKKRITVGDLYLVYILDVNPRGKEYIGYSKQYEGKSKIEIGTFNYNMKEFMDNFNNKYDVTDERLNNIAKASIKHITRRAGSLSSQKNLNALARMLIYQKLHEIVTASAYSMEGRKAVTLDLKDIKFVMRSMGITYSFYKKKKTLKLKKNSNTESTQKIK